MADALWQPRERSSRVAGSVVPRSEGNGAVGKDGGSLSPFIVLIESRETPPWGSLRVGKGGVGLRTRYWATQEVHRGR